MPLSLFRVHDHLHIGVKCVNRVPAGNSLGVGMVVSHMQMPWTGPPDGLCHGHALQMQRQSYLFFSGHNGVHAGLVISQSASHKSESTPSMGYFGPTHLLWVTGTRLWYPLEGLPKKNLRKKLLCTIDYL